jgi:hypothetical protein
MKKKLIFVAPFLLLVPLAAFAYDYYGHIVGCGINTIPKFVKASLGIIIKIGIPVASIFLIWVGFLFLTAQGDPGKLTAAKKAFVWTCIGFGVLLAAWIIAIAMETVITSFSGGNPQDTTITPC